MYMICSNRTRGKYEYGKILQLIILYSDDQVQSNLQYRGNNAIQYTLLLFNYSYNLIIFCYWLWSVCNLQQSLNAENENDGTRKFAKQMTYIQTIILT